MYEIYVEDDLESKTNLVCCRSLRIWHVAVQRFLKEGKTIELLPTLSRHSIDRPSISKCSHGVHVDFNKNVSE